MRRTTKTKRKQLQARTRARAHFGDCGQEALEGNHRHILSMPGYL